MKKRIVPKTTLILLLFTLLLAWSAVLPGRADSLIKSKEFTTRTFYADGDDDEVEFTENFGFAGDSYLNSGRFRMDITLTACLQQHLDLFRWRAGESGYGTGNRKPDQRQAQRKDRYCHRRRISAGLRK